MKIISDLKIKILEKILKKGYGFFNYPKQLKNIKKINLAYKKNKNITAENFFKKTKSKKKIIIKLASLEVKTNSYDFWSSVEKFKDLEDIESAHRWIWVYELLDNSTIDLKTKKTFISESINNWFYIFSKLSINKKNIIFESYTISERISTYVCLVKMGIIKFNANQIKILNNQFIYLTENIEFYHKKQSNHILNNLRAILIYSKFIKSKKHIKFFFNYFLKTCKSFCDSNGFFKFGSSHYQFIFTRWLIDIWINNFKNKFLKNKIKSALGACKYFLINDKKNINIPLFGNVSPDFSPSYISNLTNNIIKKKNIKNKIYSNFLIKEFKKNSIIKINTSKDNLEWKKLIGKNFSIFVRNPNISGFDFNHSHNDFFHFVLFVKNIPFIIDVGRKNYSDKSKKYLFGKYHNSIFVNDKNIFDFYFRTSLFKNLYFFKKFTINNHYFKFLKNYSSKKNNDHLVTSYFNKQFKLKRIIKIKNSKNLEFFDIFQSKNKDRISSKLFVNPNFKIVLKKKYIFFSYRSLKIEARYKSNTTFYTKYNREYSKNPFVQKYGSVIYSNNLFFKFNENKSIIFDINFKICN